MTMRELANDEVQVVAGGFRSAHIDGGGNEDLFVTQTVTVTGGPGANAFYSVRATQYWFAQGGGFMGEGGGAQLYEAETDYDHCVNQNHSAHSAAIAEVERWNGILAEMMGLEVPDNSRVSGSGETLEVGLVAWAMSNYNTAVGQLREVEARIDACNGPDPGA